MSARPVVAVTGLNATDNPGPGVALIRALRAGGFQGTLIGLAYDALDPGLYLPGLVDHAFLIPYPSAGREALFERLAHIRRRCGLDVLMPTLDSEMPALLDQEERLRAMGIGTFLPTRGQFDMRSKARLTELAEHGIPVPEGQVLSDPNAIYKVDLGFPLVIKGVFYGARLCYSFDEAVGAFHSVAAKWGLPVIAQRFVPGEEVNVCAVGDGQGGALGAVAMKKLLLTDSGKGWAGVTIRDAGLQRLTRDFMRVTRWRGPCELEVRKERDGQMHLIEVNPRFPAWCDLTQGAGQNLIQAVVDLAQGARPMPLPEPQAGVAFIRASTNHIVPISALEALTTLGERIQPLEEAR